MAEQGHRERMSKTMRRYTLVAQRGASKAGSGKMLVQQVFEAVMTQRSLLGRWKYWIGRMTLTFSQPTAQHRDRILA